MKYYSESLDRLFDNEAELEAAELQKKTEEEAAKRKAAEKEAAAAKRKAERVARAKEVQAAYDEASEKVKHAEKLLTAFCKDYGPYHMSVDKKNDLLDPFSLLRWLW